MSLQEDFEELMAAQAEGSTLNDPDGDEAVIYELVGSEVFGRYYDRLNDEWVPNAWHNLSNFTVVGTPNVLYLCVTHEGGAFLMNEYPVRMVTIARVYEQTYDEHWVLTNQREAYICE